MRLKVGDKIKGKLLTDYETKNMKITGIVNNYHLNYIYMNSDSYQKTFGKKYQLNTVFMKANYPSHVRHIIEKTKGIKNVELTRTTMNRLETNMKSIKMVVVILIILASLLAIVVLYSVTNINIEERQREIATLKVLGFKDSETNAYIFRETFGLSLMGTIIGLFFGVILFQQVIQSFGTEYYIFDTSMNLMTFVYSTCFSILFTVIINLLMIPKIRKIDMLQSLKSVD